MSEERDEVLRRALAGDGQTVQADSTDVSVHCSFTVPGLDELDAPQDAEAAAAWVARADRYDDRGEIGRGGMGTVSRCFDRVLLREVAVKTLRDSGTASMQFVEEAQITGQLDHPNIVPVHDLGVRGAREAFFTMKLVKGRTLSEEIEALHQGGFTSEALEDVLRVLLKVCEAVAFAHSRGVVHRDLKPANVMVGSHGQVYVMDWGLGLLLDGARPSGRPAAPRAEAAVATTSQGAGSGMGFAGTVGYMAPEQAAGVIQGIGTHTDVFALGAMLYHVLTGRAPYSARDPQNGLSAVRQARVVPPPEVAKRPLPPGLCEIAMRALRREPAERQPSVDALREELEDFLRGGGWFATRRYTDGEEVVREGEVADAAYVVVSGECVVDQTRAGKRVRIRSMRPGDVFGETALVSKEPRTATVSAVGDVTVKVVTADAFGRELERSPLLHAVVRQLTTRLLDAERRVREIESGRPPA
jgi:eukaryotic-like serine/threonine-protein kinase